MSQWGRLVHKAEENIEAAELLLQQGYFDIAAHVLKGAKEFFSAATAYLASQRTDD